MAGGGGGEGRGTNFVSLRSFIRIKSINLDKVDIHRLYTRGGGYSLIWAI